MSMNPWDLQRALKDLKEETEKERDGIPANRFQGITFSEESRLHHLDTKLAVLRVIEEVFDRADYHKRVTHNDD